MDLISQHNAKVWSFNPFHVLEVLKMFVASDKNSLSLNGRSIDDGVRHGKTVAQADIGGAHGQLIVECDDTLGLAFHLSYSEQGIRF